MSLRALHISDLHFNDKNSFDRDVVLAALIEHVELSVREGRRPNVIFVTGDIAYSGKATEYSQATAFFDQLLSVCQLEKSSLFVVPGNHDVNRSHVVGLARTLTSTSESDLYFDSASVCPHAIHGQRGFADWYNVYFENIRVFSLSSSFSQPEKITEGGISLAICLMNTALFCKDDNDAENLWIGRRSLFELSAQADQLKADFDVLLMHHPLSYLANEERLQCERSIDDNFDIILSGHLHEHETFQRFNGTSSALRLVSGAAYQDAPWKKALQWLVIDKRKVTVEPVCYHSVPKPTWTRDTAPFPTNRNIDYCQDFDVTISRTVVPTAPSKVVEQILDDQSLFQTRSGKSILIEPRICDVPISAMAEAQPYNELSITQLASKSESLHIEANNEHGGTVVAKLLLNEIKKNGDLVAMYNSQELPNYEKKITEFLTRNVGNEQITLIIDDFDASANKKLLDEIAKTGMVVRVVLIVPIRSITGSLDIHPSQSAFNFVNLHIWG